MTIRGLAITAVMPLSVTTGHMREDGAEGNSASAQLRGNHESRAGWSWATFGSEAMTHEHKYTISTGLPSTRRLTTVAQRWRVFRA